jgi:osmotically-inducible protein OsmY
MPESAAILDRARSALRSEPRLDMSRTPVALAFADGVMTIEGEVETIAAKKLALERLTALPTVERVVDRLHVKPAQAMADGQIRDLVRDALLDEAALSDVAIREVVKGHERTVREPPVGANGSITVRIEDGIVTLDGEVRSYAQKSLAGVLAWWVPGSRDVVNGLGIDPPEEATDGEVTEAVRVALEKDPFVNPSQIRVSTAGRVVTLTGLVPTDAEREMAEFDAWYVFGVDRVINQIAVRR